jgi:predicted O-linked N-acetylglucosamine transferase (SPINDLY family)
MLDDAVSHHRQGRLDAAVALYDRVLAVQPDQFDALHLGGLARFQAGDARGAAERLARAVAAAPGSPDAQINYAVVLSALGQFAPALAACDRAIALAPDRPDAHYGRGNVLCAVGRYAEGVASYDRVLARMPDHVDTLVNRGNALGLLGRGAEALDAYERALAADPSNAGAWINRGTTLLALGRAADALASCDRGIALRADDAEAHFGRGNALRALGRDLDAIAAYDRTLSLNPNHFGALVNRGNALLALERTEEALACYDRVLRSTPDHVETLFNRGNALRALGRQSDAIAVYDRVLVLRPDHADAMINRGNALDDLGRFDDALASYDRALAARPDDAEALNGRGNVLLRLGRLDDSLDVFRRALAARPDQANALAQSVFVARWLCDWREIDRVQARIMARLRDDAIAIDPFLTLALTDDPGLQLQAARRQWKARFGRGAPLAARPPGASDRIRLGYLSGDFRQHAIAMQTVALFERHDRARFEVVAFSYGADDGSAMRGRVMGAFDRFHDLRGLSRIEIARRIRAEQIDLLVELSGYIRDGHPEILGYRPAPVQAHYFGYPGPLGSDAVDYMLVDGFIVPPEARAHYDARLAILPDCYMVSDSRRRVAARRPTRAECGLPEGGFVFCSFNNGWKLSPETFDVWMRLLRAVPGSVLWLLADNRWAEANLRREAAARGVDAGRLAFAPRCPPDEHLARLALADLFLDTLPYNAHVTASEALWMGLPLLTCAGRSFASRVAGSLLHSVGVPELVTGNLADYEALALALARDPDRLQALRSRLAAARTTAAHFDIERMRRAIEAAYETMVERWRRGLKPESFVVPAQDDAVGTAPNS